MRKILTIEEGKRYLGIMPAVAEDAMGVKLVAFYPGNAGTSVPTHMAMILLFRPETGEPLAAMDGRLVTEMRTAAVSAAVTNSLASPDSHVLALLGSGVQAKAHLEALAHVREFDDVRVWSRTPEHAKRFADEHHAKATDAESAVRGADVVVTATNAHQPILMGAWLKPGAHVNAVGAPRPTWRELDDAAMANRLVVDSREAESGRMIACPPSPPPVDEPVAPAKKKAVAAKPKAALPSKARQAARRPPLSSRATPKAEKLVCRYCGSDDLSPSFK